MSAYIQTILAIWAGLIDLFSSGPAILAKSTPTRQPLYLYNTLGKEKQSFTLPEGVRAVRMYNCGPTVYDRQHIGNLSAAVFADILRRTLEFDGYSVKQVINITDFGHLVSDADDGEDKMTKGLKREKLTPTMQNMRDFATKYMDIYLADIKALNVATDAITFPRASDYVPAMIAMIKALEEKGYAYRTPDGVYFDTKQFASYGCLGGIDLEGLKEGARVAKNASKRHPTDFAIWKSTPPTAPKRAAKLGWDSPWGKGFPGWHIECSAMINSVLGKQIDIHTGGIEHVAIHHNNEIAQSEAATGKQPFSRFWMHRAHIQMGGAKLAKSTGNTAYLSDLAEHKIHPLALRYWFLTSHYRTQANFTWEALEGAQHAYIRLQQRMDSVRGEDTVAPPPEFATAFAERINDDLDTPAALALVWDSLKNEAYTSAEIKAVLLLADSVFAIGLTTPDAELKSLFTKPASISASDLPATIQSLVESRSAARAAKDWPESDRLRDEILAAGYAIKDGPSGQEVTKS